MNYVFEGTVLWSQIDANVHLRHSAYSDFAAQGRIALLSQNGFGTQELLINKIGPILFREELVYLREVGMNDHVKVTCELTRCKRDGSRWSFIQEIYRADGIKAAIVYTDGAWINTEVRKLAVLPEHLLHHFEAIPKHTDFNWE